MGELGAFPSPLGAACPNGATFLPPVCVPHVPPKLPVPTRSPPAWGRSGVPRRPPPGAAGRAGTTCSSLLLY